MVSEGARPWGRVDPETFKDVEDFRGLGHLGQSVGIVWLFMFGFSDVKDLAAFNQSISYGGIRVRVSLSGKRA